MDLASSKSEGIKENLASRCAARELFKYSAYLDACSLAVRRLDALKREKPYALPWTGVYKPPTTYDIGVRFIRREIDNADGRIIAKRRMQRGYLLANWTSQQCEAHGYVLIPGLTFKSKTSNEHLLSWEKIRQRSRWPHVDYRILDLSYHKILRIAAKSGDNWAIRSYSLSSPSGRAFKADLVQQYPILIHRWIGRNGKSELTRRHQAKAYLMLKEKAGEAIARLEFDPTKLSKEIRYVQDGGELTYP